MDLQDVCGEEGCNRVFHHACQCEWEYTQYKTNYPNGDPSIASYDSEGKKQCMHHHPHSEIALLSRTTTGVDALHDECDKKSAVPKKPPKVSKEDKLNK